MEKSGSDIAVATTELCKRYGQNIALDGTSFAVTKGSIFGIIGADGAGKTTLLKTLATLIRPDSGSASICGFNLAKQYREIRRHIGYMPENFSLYADLTVWENISFYASLFNVPITANLQVIEPVFKQLAPFKNRKAGKLSGGMKQKLALSCALIHQPELLLLDEPTRGVDPISRKEFWTILTAITVQRWTLPYIGNTERYHNDLSLQCRFNQQQRPIFLANNSTTLGRLTNMLHVWRQYPLRITARLLAK